MRGMRVTKGGTIRYENVKLNHSRKVKLLKQKPCTKTTALVRYASSLWPTKYLGKVDGGNSAAVTVNETCRTDYIIGIEGIYALSTGLPSSSLSSFLAALETPLGGAASLRGGLWSDIMFFLGLCLGLGTFSRWIARE